MIRSHAPDAHAISSSRSEAALGFRAHSGWAALASLVSSDQPAPSRLRDGGCPPVGRSFLAIIAIGRLEPRRDAFSDGTDFVLPCGVGRILAHLRFAFRSLRRRPALAATCAGVLALGISAVTTIFGITSGLLFRPLPYPAADRLVFVYYLGGQMKFDEKGRRVGAGLAIIQWQNGVPVTVYPPEAGVAAPIWPKK